MDLPLHLATPRWCYVATAIAVVALYLLSVMPIWRPTPDSALYLSLARSLADGDGYLFNGKFHGIVTPGLPMILAALRLACGECFWVFNLFISLCALGTLWLIYVVIRRLAGSGLALAVVLMTAFSYTFYLAAHKIITDIVFSLIFWATLYCYLRWREGGARWLVMAAGLSLAGVFVRAPGLLVLGALALGVLLTPRKSERFIRRIRPAAAILLPIALLAGAMFVVMYMRTGKVPVYLSAFWSNIVVWKAKYTTIFDGLANLPIAMSEMLTGQDGLGISHWGFLATIFAVVGAGVLWRRGQQWIPVTAFIPLMILAFMGGSIAVRPRYIIPVMPLLFYMTLTGLCWCMLRVPRGVLWRITIASSIFTAGWYAMRPEFPFYYPVLVIAGTWLLVEVFLYLAGKFGNRRRSLEVAITVFAMFGVIASSPRILHDAVYYGYLSYTDRYYREVRKGAHAEIHAMGKYLRENCPPQKQVAARGDRVAIFHYLSGRVIAFLPNSRAESPAEAEQFARFVLSDENNKIHLVVVDLAGGNILYVNRLVELLDAAPMLRLRKDYPGERYRVYERSVR